MGYDRIAYFKGNGESTLVSANKSSSDTVYNGPFSVCAKRLGLAARLVVDTDCADRYPTSIMAGEAVVETLPIGTHAEISSGYPVAEGLFVELSPPPTPDQIKMLNAFLRDNCRPSDAGLILDYRGPEPRTMATF